MSVSSGLKGGPKPRGGGHGTKSNAGGFLDRQSSRAASEFGNKLGKGVGHKGLNINSSQGSVAGGDSPQKPGKKQPEYRPPSTDSTNDKAVRDYTTHIPDIMKKRMI
jgi:hypothetical protein